MKKNNKQNVFSFIIDSPAEQLEEWADEAARETGSSVRRVGKSEGAAGGVAFTLSVYEKFFWRTRSYCSLSLMIISIEGKSRLTIIASGGGESLLNWDYGSARSFVQNFLANLSEKTGMILEC